MFETKVTFALLDFNDVVVVLAAGEQAVRARVQLLPSKTSSLPPVEFDTVSVNALTTRAVEIEASHAAFQGGYGAVRVTSVDASGSEINSPFIAYATVRVREAEFFVDRHPVSCANTWGNRFRLPFIRGNERIRIAVTSLDSPQQVVIKDPRPGGYNKTFAVGADATFLWDSNADGTDDNGTRIDVKDAGLLEVASAAGGDITTSAVIRRIGIPPLVRVYPLLLEQS
jgi:hypothetical protein